LGRPDAGLTIFELSQSFYFEAAHTLRRQLDDAVEVAGSRRIHGHTYQAEVTVCGQRDAATGMVVDLALLRAVVARVRGTLDHHFLDEIDGLGAPTLENLCLYIHRSLAQSVPGVTQVSVWRQSSGDRCVYRPDRSATVGGAR
jgi:6-pyruvoyltetrahydropterin/6-carboxytetrahydropterin synthase